jgi:hypothetical protein
MLMRSLSRLAALAAVVAAGLGVVPAAAAAGNGTQLWAKTVFTPNCYDAGYATVVSPDGRLVFVTGTSNPAGAGDQFAGLTVAYSTSTGAKVWQVRTKPVSQLVSIAVSPDGATVYAAGYFGQLTNGLTVVAYRASTGALLWQHTGGSATGDTDPVAVSPSGSQVYVSGYRQVLALAAATGKVQWTYTDGLKFGYSALVAGHTAVFVAGQSSSSPSKAVVEALNAATGARLWRAAHPAADGAWFSALALSPDGTTVYAGGGQTGAGGTSALVEAAYTAATGASAWLDTGAGMPGGSAVDGLAASPDGSAVFVTANISYPNRLGVYEQTSAFAATTGKALWRKNYASPPGRRGQAEASGIVVSPDSSRVYVGGYETLVAQGPPRIDWLTVAYNAATGKLAWRALYHHLSEARALALAVSPGGSEVFVTGESAEVTAAGATSSYMSTAAYRS